MRTEAKLERLLAARSDLEVFHAVMLQLHRDGVIDEEDAVKVNRILDYILTHVGRRISEQLSV